MSRVDDGPGSVTGRSLAKPGRKSDGCGRKSDGVLPEVWRSLAGSVIGSVAKSEYPRRRAGVYVALSKQENIFFNSPGLVINSTRLTMLQCSESVTFRYATDPAPDAALFVSYLQKILFLKVFLLTTFTSFFTDIKPSRSHKTIEIKGFLFLLFLLDLEGSGSILRLTGPDRPKTYGSGTLVRIRMPPSNVVDQHSFQCWSGSKVLRTKNSKFYS